MNFHVYSNFTNMMNFEVDPICNLYITKNATLIYLWEKIFKYKQN